MRNSEKKEIKDENNGSKRKMNLRASLPVFSKLHLKLNDDKSISRETLNSIYGNNYDLIISKITETENQTISYLSETNEELQKRYKDFNSDINTHFRNLTNKITDAFNLNNNNETEQNNNKETLIKKYSSEYIEQLEKIINMHEQILKNIKNTISIFYNFLDISKFLSKEKPLNEFLSKEFKNIIDNWLFTQINLENFDFTKAINESNFDTDFKNLLIKIRKNKDFIMNISTPVKYMKFSKKNFERLHADKVLFLNSFLEKNKKILSDNHDNLVKLKMKNIFFADKYFEPDVTYSKVKFLKFDNVTFKLDEKKNNFLERMPVVEKLIINSSNDFEISLLKDLSKSLIKLSLTKNGFVDYDFENIFSKYLIVSESIRKNLLYLSFSDNYLSNVNLSEIVHQPRQSFLALKELDLHSNKIYQFNINQEYFPDLECINCCNNNLTMNTFEQYNGILTLLSGNVFLSQKNLAENYFTALSKKISSYPISLRYLNLSFIPKLLSNDYISNIIINDNILINLRKLDLSHNNLKCDTVLNFFKNNKGCLSLKSLNLSYNLLDSTLLEKFLDAGLNNHFTKLKYIKLDSNKLGNFEDFNGKEKTKNEKCIEFIQLLYKFIYENRNLVELNITKNPIRNELLIKTIEENADNFIFQDFVIRDEKGYIEIKCFYSFLWKIKIEMNQENKTNKSEVRPIFNLKFDCKNAFNNNSEEFEVNTNYIVFVNQE